MRWGWWQATEDAINPTARLSVNNNLLAVQLRPFRDGIKSEGLSFDRLLHAFACITGNQLIHRVIYNKSNPRWSEHIIHEVVLMEAPIVTDFSDLDSLQVVIVAD